MTPSPLLKYETTWLRLHEQIKALRQQLRDNAAELKEMRAKVWQAAVEAAAEQADLTEEDVLSRRRTLPLFQARAAAFHAAHTLGVPVCTLAKLSGWRHPTILHNLWRVEHDPHLSATASLVLDKTKKKLEKVVDTAGSPV
jgi:hypothetical protein